MSKIDLGAVSTYAIAVENGFEGTEAEWLESLKGASGKSAYQIAVDDGYSGTESEWLASLKGEKGDKGESAVIGKSHRTASTVGQWIIAFIPMDYVNGEKYIVKLHSNSSLKDLTMCSLIDDKSINQSNRVTIYSNEFVSYDDTPFYFVANENDETQAHVFAIFGQTTVANQTLDMSVYQNTTIKEQDKIIPPYYFVDNYLDNKIDEIRDNSCITSGVNFAFITDLHFNFNAMKSNLLLNYVFDKTTVPFAVCGGDIVESYGTEEHAINAANTYIEYANSLHKPIFTIHGNHDLCIRTSAQDSSGYSASEAVLNNYTINTADKTRIKGVNGKRYYYIDDDFEKVRMIVLDDYVELMDVTKAGGSYNDEGIGLDQIIWLKDVALNADGYTFIIMAHGGGDDSLIGYNRIMKNTVYPILKAINNRTAFSITVDNTEVTGDYTDTNNYVACVLAGHTHRDESRLSEGLLTITTACDARYADDPNNGARTLATITEQAFDIFSIDTTTRKIKTVRIGAGHNREWTY